MLSLIQNEVVVQHQWMTAAEFADIVAVSQITPGPIAIDRKSTRLNSSHPSSSRMPSSA